MLGPLVAAGLVDIAQLYRSLQQLASTGTAAELASLLLAAAAKGENEAAQASSRAAAESRAISLVSLIVPGHKAISSVRAALGSVLDALYPELAALEGLRSLVVEAARSDPPASEALAAAVATALAALPASGLAASEFARGLVSEGVALALDEGDAALLSRLAPALAATAARAGNGVLALNAAQVVIAAKEAEGVPEGSVLAAFKALAASDGAAVGKDALLAWVAGGAGVAEPVGRETALEQTRVWVASL